MQLPSHQTERFYRIWLALLYYINEQRQLVPPFPNTPQEVSLPTTDVLELRKALWADESLLNAFIAENPAGLSSADLSVVDSWHDRLAGNFFIVRYLKKYTVFLSEQGSQASNHLYGVQGLISPIEEVVGPYLPIYVEAVLLPFEGQIIYDSLLQPYRISFGPGIRKRLNATYRNTQEREGIITSLGSASEAPTSPQELLARNEKILSAFRKELARKGLSHTMVEQHASNIETFAQTSLLAQVPPRGLLEITLADVQTYLNTTGNRTNTTSFKRFVRFLDETDRVDYEQSEPLREFLKHARD